MAATATTAFWGMVINNYDETDLALVQQGYPDFVRQIVYTLERGEEKKTPHIQAFVRLHRQQRMSYMRKLFPGASDFKALTSDEYKLNAQRYAQKLDSTAESPAVISNNPFPDPVVELVSVIEEAFSTPDINEYHWDKPRHWASSQPERHVLLQWIDEVEFRRVRKSPRLAKFYVGATYKNVKDKFLDALKAHVFDLQKSVDTHTHTHSDEKFSREGGINKDAIADEGSQESEVDGSEDEGEDDEGDDYSEGSESEASDESYDSGCSESDAESED